MLEPIAVFNSDQALAELQDFEIWLSLNKFFKENKVVEKLKSYRMLCPALMSLELLRQPAAHRFEAGLAGLARIDYLVTNAERSHFVFVEFEGGERGSIFKRGKKHSFANWSAQLEHGFSQISDWTWIKRDQYQTETFREAFGPRPFTETYILVCGRDEGLSGPERSRLDHRSTHTIVSGARIMFLTYDQLLTYFRTYLGIRVQQSR